MIREMRRKAQARRAAEEFFLGLLATAATLLVFGLMAMYVSNERQQHYYEGVQRYEQELREQGAPEDAIYDHKFNYRPEMYEQRR